MTTTEEPLGTTLVQKILGSQQNACYVLITCGHPSDEGKMDVELTYEGDEALASYLVEAAYDFIQQPE